MALLAAFWITGASAQSGPLKESNPYLSLLLTGTNSIDGPEAASGQTFPPSGGLGLAPAIGYRWLPLRAELEYHFFSSNDFLVSELLTIRALTANVILEWQVTKPLGVYIGAGYGRARVSDSGAHEASGDGNAQQVQLGITLGSPNAWQLLLGYRWFATGHLGLTDAQGRPFENDKLKMSMAQIGMRLNF